MRNPFTTELALSKRGFTLIELLVVIAIIAILAAILFPVFSRARENARRASCQSNLKQIGLGILQYTQDYDERFPQGTWTDNRGVGWAGQIQPYAKSVQIFKCPSDRFTSTFIAANPNTSTGNNFGPPYTCSYYYNNNFAGIIQYDLPFQNNMGMPVTQSQLNAPTRSVLVWEATEGIMYSNPANEGIENTSPASNGNDQRGGQPATGQMSGGISGGNSQSGVGSTPRHFDGANFLAADGHVKWLKPESVSVGRTAWGSNPGADSAQSTGNPAGAEGTNYNGSDKRALTMSPK